MKVKSTPDGVQGEGNYKAAKEYGDSVKDFVKSGKVEKAAKNAKESTPEEEAQMTQSEEVGLSKSKDKKAMPAKPGKKTR
jgi:hypothetical protein